MQIEKKLEELGLRLPPPPPRGGLYKSCKPFGANLAYVSGCGCVITRRSRASSASISRSSRASSTRATRCSTSSRC